MKESSQVVSSPVQRIVASLALAGVLASPAVGQTFQGSIQGTVRCDTNPLPGITVVARALTGPGVPLSSVTDPNGRYSLSVVPGFYEVTLGNLPSGLAYVTPPDGVNYVPIAPGVASAANFSLTGGEPAELAALGGSVWLDLDCDGIRHPDEPGIAAVPVTLLNCQAQLVSETFTDEQGSYMFEDLPAGSYVVHFLAPDCRLFTQYQQGADPERDSNADPEFGVTECITLTEGVTDLTWDAGMCRVEGPGTSGQGYWKTHPRDWPMDDIQIGGVTYDRYLAIAIMREPTRGNKRLNMFEQLVAAKLNRAVCNESAHIDEVIMSADLWMEQNPGLVRASAAAWQRLGNYLHSQLEDYNDGRVCALLVD